MKWIVRSKVAKPPKWEGLAPLIAGPETHQLLPINLPSALRF